MGNWFRGSYATDGIIYDYTCRWYRDDEGVRWRADVGEDESAYSTAGRVHEAASECELLVVISACVEREIEERLPRRLSAAAPEKTEGRYRRAQQGPNPDFR